MDVEDRLAGRFEASRPRLRAMAYRMLGSMSEAEDAVQEGWLRLNRTDTSDVVNLSGWLTTVVARVCLDQLRARDSRREDALEQRVPLNASEECFPFRPIDSNGSDLRTARTKRGLNNRQHFAGRKFTDTLFGEKLGDAFVSRNIAFSAEHTPVYR